MRLRVVRRLGSSPLGSLSPDATAHAARATQLEAVLGGASALAGAGRGVLDREGGERGRDRRGRERTSGKVLGGGVAASPPPCRFCCCYRRRPLQGVWARARARSGGGA